jgi:hypothetical protein
MAGVADFHGRAMGDAVVLWFDVSQGAAQSNVLLIAPSAEAR